MLWTLLIRSGVSLGCINQPLRLQLHLYVCKLVLNRVLVIPYASRRDLLLVIVHVVLVTKGVKGLELVPALLSSVNIWVTLVLRLPFIHLSVSL